MNSQWQQRYGHTRNHKAYDVAMSLPLPNIPDIGLTKFALAMPDKYMNNDPVKAYRDYYIGDKRHIAQWKNGIPYWWK